MTRIPRKIRFNPKYLRNRMLMAYAVPESKSDFEIAAGIVEKFNAHLADYPEDADLSAPEVIARFMPSEFPEGANSEEIATAVCAAVFKIKGIVAAVTFDENEPFPEF